MNIIFTCFFFFFFFFFLRHIRHIKANDILLKEDGNFIDDKKVLAEVFNDYFVNISEDAYEITEMDYGTDFIERPSIRAIVHNKAERETFKFQLVSSSEVDLLLSSVNSRKPCGHDMLHPTLLKLSAPVIALPVSKIINSSIILCSYPVRWKMGQVTPLFKKDRPVTVLPILNNIYERVLSDQLSVYFKDILSDFISAYRKNYSCESTLLRLTEDWRAGLDNKELVAVISLDLSKAFDCVPHELLLAKLKVYGVAEQGVALLRNYLSGRSQRVNY